MVHGVGMFSFRGGVSNGGYIRGRGALGENDTFGASLWLGGALTETEGSGNAPAVPEGIMS